MRLITSFEERESARRFYSLLVNEGIDALYEMDENKFKVWIYDEEQLEKAEELLAHFKENPNDSKFDVAEDVHVEQPRSEPSEISEDPIFLARVQEMRKKVGSKMLYSHIGASVTKLTILLCVILFLVGTYQRYAITKNIPEEEKKTTVVFTPLEEKLLYDTPHAVNVMLPTDATDAEKLAMQTQAKQYWVGLYYIGVNWPESKDALNAPKFVKIGEGQIWRLITPVVLHGGILHILFNMMWLWLLGKQIEERIGKWRYVLMMIIIGVISNTAEYLMVGPAFLGFSGVICGQAGFIWMRQRCAPWEGYPLQKGAALFLAIFVLGIAAIQVVSFILKLTGIGLLPIQIANTAHIMGALVGIVMAKVSLFSRTKHQPPQ